MGYANKQLLFVSHETMGNFSVHTMLQAQRLCLESGHYVLHLLAHTSAIFLSCGW